jgi:hypothetical protein
LIIKRCVKFRRGLCFLLKETSLKASSASEKNFEFGEFRVVGGTQNCLRIREKNLYVHGEDTKRHKTEDILVNNGPINSICKMS